MGMDVSGKAPTSEAGAYFRANVWSWRVIQDLCIKTGHGEAAQWSTNDGYGLLNQEACNKLADDLERYIKENPEQEYALPLPKSIPQMGVDEHGRFGKGTLSPWRARVEHIREFITFLRHCGGFEVW